MTINIDMSKNQIIETFNKHFMEFITDVERVFPSDPDIISTRKSVSKSIFLMPKTLIRLFNDNFSSLYGDEIDRGDLNFFIDNDYRAKHANQADDAWNKIDSLREPVRNMSDENKEKVIQYLKNLKKLSDLYNNLKKINKK